MRHPDAQAPSARTLPAASALLVWALAAGSLVLWWLHMPRAGQLSGSVSPSVVSSPPVQKTDAVQRALGHRHVHTVAPEEQSRFKLLGVIASASGRGSALIAIDGQPARAYVMGHELEESGWTLQALTPTTATLQSQGRSLELVLAGARTD